MAHEENKQLFRGNVPEPSSDFVSRIIASAVPRPQKLSLHEYITLIFKEFLLPSPSVLFVSLALAGFFAGFLDNSTILDQTNNTSPLGQFLYDTESFI